MVELGSPQDWAQGAGAFKTGVEAIGAVIRIMKDLGGRKASPQKQVILDKAIGEAEKAAKLADAQTAKALQFPPLAMLRVGYHNGRKDKEGPVHECPSCGRNTAAPYSYTRLAPPRP